MNRLKKSLLICLSASLLPIVAAAQGTTAADTASATKKSKQSQDIAKYLTIYADAIRETDMFFVDTINLGKMVTDGLQYSLSTLDPYTTYISYDDLKDFNYMTTGEYAGVGAVIASRDSLIYITDVYEGTPACKAGLRGGDIFLKIDDLDCHGATVSAASEHLRGTANTPVKVKVQKVGQKSPSDITIVRDNITISSIPLATLIPGTKTGVIDITSFTKGTYSDFRDNFLRLKRQGMQSLVIDLRDNPGGLLSEAIRIVNMFVQKGDTLVYTKGKFADWNEVYVAEDDPIDRNMPICIMVDDGSASAAEILAGTLQDLDRAVIVGERTYGKGLVQTTRDLPYGGKIKMTISKYHIPSGRCVQAIDYAQRDEKGRVSRIPDSLTTVYYTRAGREVRDGCGILPDTSWKKDVMPDILYNLYENNVIFDFVTDYQKRHSKIAPVEKFALTDADFEDFRVFVTNKEFDYKTKSQKILDELEKAAKSDSLYEQSKSQIEALRLSLSHCRDAELDKAKTEIMEVLSIDIARRYYLQKGNSYEMMKHDHELDICRSILEDRANYDAMLKPKKSEAKK